MTLLFKLQILEVGESVLGMLRDFLSGRQQCIVLDVVFSGPRPILSNNPQGNILNPSLLLVNTLIW